MRPIAVEAQQRDLGLPAGWARTKFGEIYELAYGKSLTKRSRNTDGKYSVYGSNGIVDHHDAFLVEGPALVVGRKGAAGAVSFSRKPCWPIDTTYYVRDSEHIDIRFSFYLLTSLHLNQFDRSTAIPGLNRDDAYDLVVCLPPLGEQQRIVAKIEELFSELDKGVASLKTAREQLNVYRQAVLKHAFEGKLTEQWREENKDKLESPDVLVVRIREEREVRYRAALDDWEQALAEWRESGEKGKKPAKPRHPVKPEKCDSDNLRDVPNGWIYLPFEALAWSIRNGTSVKPDEKGPLKIFRISAVRPMAFDLDDFRQITDSDGSMEDYRLAYGDLVFTRYNGSRSFVGVSALYRGDGTHLHPDKLIRCKLKSDIINAAYLEAATNCGESRTFLEKRIRTTAGQSGVSGRDIKATPVPICSTAEQVEIVQILDARLEAAETLRAEIEAALARAESLRQSILKKAFSGQLVSLANTTDEPVS